MKLSALIARRYFLARSSSNAVNIITGISVLGILVGTTALIIVLSAFNGLENLVKGFYQAFDPALKITATEGKYFSPKLIDSSEVLQNEAIATHSYTLAEKALFSYQDHEYIATLKGVDAQFDAVTAIKAHLSSGRYRLEDSLNLPPAVLGGGVAYRLGFGPAQYDDPLQVFVPGKLPQGLNLSGAYRQQNIYPTGIFAIQPEFDEKYVLVPLGFAQQLYRRPQQISAVELKLKPQAKPQAVKEALQAQLGQTLQVQTREEQQAVFFKVMKTEGLFTFLVFALILAIATFTIAGSLSMLLFEKRANLQTLHALGMSLVQLRRIFFYEGLIISGTGGFIGLALGLLLVWLQQQYGLIEVGSGYIVEAYPVALQGQDVLQVAATVFVLSLVASYFTSRRLKQAHLHQA